MAASAFARRLGARLHVVHAICMDDYPTDPDAADWEEQGAATVAEQRHHVQQLLADSPVPWAYEARHGEPAAVLTRAATESNALAIVVGSRGEGLRRALARLADPSVSHGVIGHQHFPVLVVPLPHTAETPAQRPPRPRENVADGQLHDQYPRGAGTDRGRFGRAFARRRRLRRRRAWR